MANLWSENIQGVLTLYLSRKLRFHDCFMKQYTDLFQLDAGKKLRILEIGCGPGALSEALHRWYPNAEIVGIDRDGKFIEFARKNEPEVTFVEGDALCLPFDDHSFDVAVSYTVSEHIAPLPFYSEQKRVLKKGGICLVLSCRKTINCIADCLKKTEAEKKFWQGIEDNGLLQKLEIGKYMMTEQLLPIEMEGHGFSHVSTAFTTVSLTPDNPNCPEKMSEDIINSERYAAIEAVMLTHNDKSRAIVDTINAKYDLRLQLLRSGNKQWDTYTTVTMILRGIND